MYPVLHDIFLPDESQKSKLDKTTGPLQLKLLFYNKKDTRQKVESQKEKMFRHAARKLLDGFLLSLSINMVTIPIILYFYFDLPLYSIFLNLCILPLMSLLLGMGILVGFAGLFSIPFGVFLGGSVHVILGIYEFLCHLFLLFPGSIITLGRQGKVFYIIYYGSLLLFWVCYHWFQKKYVIFLCIGMLCVFYVPNPSDLTVTIMDVGQGDGILIEHVTGKTFYIDGGSSSVKQLGKYRITPCLKSKGISAIDYVYITHMDQDHISGITETYGRV